MLECPCGRRRMRILAAIHPPNATQKILDCLGLLARNAGGPVPNTPQSRNGSKHLLKGRCQFPALLRSAGKSARAGIVILKPVRQWRLLTSIPLKASEKLTRYAPHQCGFWSGLSSA